MTTRTSYAWESRDPSTQFVEHALNRLRNFQEDYDEENLKATRRLDQGSDFTALDVEKVAKYLETLAKRANERVRANHHCEPEVREGIEQAADNARGCAAALRTIFAAAQNKPA